MPAVEAILRLKEDVLSEGRANLVGTPWGYWGAHKGVLGV